MENYIFCRNCNIVFNESELIAYLSENEIEKGIIISQNLVCPFCYDNSYEIIQSLDKIIRQEKIDGLIALRIVKTREAQSSYLNNIYTKKQKIFPFIYCIISVLLSLLICCIVNKIINIIGVN